MGDQDISNFTLFFYQDIKLYIKYFICFSKKIIRLVVDEMSNYCGT